MAIKLYLSRSLPAILAALTLFACQNSTDIAWRFQSPDHGSNSTPRFRDLTQDGIFDVVFGAGKHEHEEAPNGIVALDGQNGKPLWTFPSRDQIVGSASFVDIDRDGTDDVVIGGRSRQLYAINGATGDLLWEVPVDTSTKARKLIKYNFYNSQITKDYDNDGLGDILISNGGNVWALPGSDLGREAGVLMILSSSDGTVIAADTMPDGRETYFSPVILNADSPDPEIIYGTGGETHSGHLYLTKFSSLLKNDLSGSRALMSEQGHGFIAPVVVDMNEDGINDIVGISHASTIYAIDGKTKMPIWQKSIPNTESSSMPAVGYFRSIDSPDVFAFVSIGSFPRNTGTIAVLLDGTSGNIVKADTIGCFGFSSPITANLDIDPESEVIVSTNTYKGCSILFNDNITELYMIDYGADEAFRVLQSHEGKNLSITPGIVDLNSDGRMELIYGVQNNFTTIFLMYGMNLVAAPLDMSFHSIGWDTYMGTNYDCTILGN